MTHNITSSHNNYIYTTYSNKEIPITKYYPNRKQIFVLAKLAHRKSVHSPTYLHINLKYVFKNSSSIVAAFLGVKSPSVQWRAIADMPSRIYWQPFKCHSETHFPIIVILYPHHSTQPHELLDGLMRFDLLLVYKGIPYIRWQ